MLLILFIRLWRLNVNFSFNLSTCKRNAIKKKRKKETMHHIRIIFRFCSSFFFSLSFHRISILNKMGQIKNGNELTANLTILNCLRVQGWCTYKIISNFLTMFYNDISNVILFRNILSSRNKPLTYQNVSRNWNEINVGNHRADSFIRWKVVLFVAVLALDL